MAVTAREVSAPGQGRGRRKEGWSEGGLVVEGGVGGLDDHGAPGEADADVDALAGDHQGAAAVDPPIDARRSGWWGRWRSGGAGVAQPGLLGGAEWVGQAAQQGAVGVE
jgi:hypothetical protein